MDHREAVAVVTAQLVNVFSFPSLNATRRRGWRPWSVGEPGPVRPVLEEVLWSSWTTGLNAGLGEDHQMEQRVSDDDDDDDMTGMIRK